MVDDYQITDTMIRFGGGFASRLGQLFRHAAPMNQQRLKDAFPELWKAYADLVIQGRQLLERDKLNGRCSADDDAHAQRVERQT